jgi:hypothetical protein
MPDFGYGLAGPEDITVSDISWARVLTIVLVAFLLFGIAAVVFVNLL